jgi:hypothetical protein
MIMRKLINIILMIVILIYFSSIKTAQSNQDTQAISHTPSSPQFIDFIYNKPINGISVSGRFTIYRSELNPIIETYWGRYMGTVRLSLTRLSDMRTTNQEFREVSFLATDQCINEEPLNSCILEDPLFLEPNQSDSEEPYHKSFLPYVGLKIVDYDFDNKDELILVTPFAYRGGPEYFVYDIINTEKEFRIDYGSNKRIPDNVEFDTENKLMIYHYSSGACSTYYHHYKAEELEGYKRFKTVRYNSKEVNGEWICSKTVYLEQN